MIFLDNASTTRVFERSVSVMAKALNEDFYNPSALYLPSIKIKQQIQNARKTLAERLFIEQNELFFTSCATESNTWAINSGFKNKKGNIVVGSGEHASIYENAKMQQQKGVEVRFVPLNNDGTINLELLRNIVDENTSLISVIHCSNETGAINDLKTIGCIAKSKNPNVIFHSDGVQAFGKIDNNCANLCVDMYSMSAHKIGGSKGIGALFVRKAIKLSPFIIGGGQESGQRSGTENTAGILGFATALEEFKNQYDYKKIQSFKDYMIKSFKEIGGIINSEFCSSPHILSLSFETIKSEILQSMLCEQGILIGLGSACSGKTKNNRVLSQMGIKQKLIEGSIRISFGVENTFEEIELATDIIIKTVEKLRGKILG